MEIMAECPKVYVLMTLYLQMDGTTQKMSVMLLDARCGILTTVIFVEVDIPGGAIG
jgi:hypothetical protein